jgi:short-subunit dehydrogenase
MDINYHGCVRLVRAVAPAMMAAGKGLVVNMGSASAYTGGGGGGVAG